MMQTMTQKALYLANRERLQAPIAQNPFIDGFERDWIARSLSGSEDGPLPQSLAELKASLKERIAAEEAQPGETAVYVAERMTMEELRILVQEFAVDGLTEAQVFYYALPRLPLEAQMPLLRIMIDEFGSGNIKRAHTTLYLDLLRELCMPTSLDFYIDRVAEPSFAFVNVFFWLALRAEDVSYFAGALTYLETTIPAFFDCYAQACLRLNVGAHAYYTEHQHIDGFHAIEGQRLLTAMNACGVLDVGKAYRGALLASDITALAFEAAVEKAKASTR